MGLDEVDHLVVERVERLWAVERNSPERMNSFERHHGLPSGRFVSVRALLICREEGTRACGGKRETHTGFASDEAEVGALTALAGCAVDDDKWFASMAVRSEAAEAADEAGIGRRPAHEMALRARGSIVQSRIRGNGDGRLPALRSSGGGEIRALSSGTRGFLSPHYNERQFPRAYRQDGPEEHSDIKIQIEEPFATFSVSLRAVFAVLALIVATVTAVASPAATPPLVQQIGKRLPQDAEQQPLQAVGEVTRLESAPK